MKNINIFGKNKNSQKKIFKNYKIDDLPKSFYIDCEKVNNGIVFLLFFSNLFFWKFYFFQLELHPWFMRIRGGNVERYEHPDQVQFGHKFTVELFVQEDEDGPLCNIEVSTNVVGKIFFLKYLFCYVFQDNL